MNTWFPTFLRFFRGPHSFRGWWPLITTSAQRQALLRLVAVATEEHLPLLPLLESWIEDERGLQRRRLTKLARLLAQGKPLTEALEIVPGVVRDEDLLAIRFDTQMGTRSAAMRAALSDETSRLRETTPLLERAAIYFCVLIPIGLLLIAFTQLNIVPVVVRMFQDHDIALTPALAWSLNARGSMFIYLWIAAMAFIGLLWWMFATRSGRPVRYAIFGRLLRPWHGRRTSGVLRNIAVAADAGRPISGALSTLARYHFDPTIRRELLFVRNEVEQGAEVWQSLAGVGLLTQPEAQLLQGAPSSGDLAWMLNQVADVKERRTERRTTWLAEFAMPLVVAVMALLVVFQALTVIDPLTRILDNLL
jgi:type II secretory pathway component PulF